MTAEPNLNSPGAAKPPSDASPGTAGGRARRAGAITVAAIVGVSAGICLYTFNYAEGLSYLSEDPNACINCHVMQEQFDGWQHASHHRNATCNDCHVPHDSLAHKYYVKAEHGYRHSKGFTFNDFHEPIQITPGSRQVVVDNCIRCHAQIAADTTVLTGGTAGGAAPGIPSLHSLTAQSADCLHCHTRVGHGPTR